MKNYLIMQVRELMERHLNAYEIAHRLHIDVNTVNSIVEIIKQAVQ
jgi:orotate phosphoribosyltransferase-like protein